MTVITDTPRSPEVTRRGRRVDVWTSVSAAMFLVFFIFLIYPLFTLLKAAFHGEHGGFTWEYFAQFFSNQFYFGTIVNSLEVSLGSVVVSLILGVPFSYFYTFYRLRGAKVIFVGAVLTVLAAPFIAAYAWILLLGNNGILRRGLNAFLPFDVPSIYGFAGIVFVMSLKLFPLIAVYMNGAFRNIDSSILEAAELMGSKGSRRTMQLLVRLTVPTLLAASLLVFMRAFADFGVPLLIGRGFRTFTVELYTQYLGEIGQNHNFAAAIGIVGMIVTALIFWFQKFSASKFNFSLQPGRPIQKRKPKGVKGALIYLYMYGLILIALLPQLYIIYLSLRNSSQVIFLPGFSLDNYRRAIDRGLWHSMQNTLVFAAVSMLVIILLAILIAYIVVRRRNFFNNLLDTITMVPYILPGAVIGIGLVLVFNGPPLAITGTATIMIIALIIRRMPYTIRSATATLMQVPMSTEEAARSLGASKIKAFWKVTVPMMSRGIRSGAIISFLMVVIEMSSAIILYTNNTITLTMSSYVAISRGNYGLACAFAAVLTILTAVILGVYMMFTREEDVQV